MQVQSAEEENFAVHIIDMLFLKGHEKVDAQRLAALRAEIEADGVLKRPIVVDVRTNVVLDGHHRIAALKALGCSKIPVILVDYQSPKIGVRTSEKGEEYPKRKVIEAALKGELLPPKSTWHYVICFKEIAHISKLQRLVNVPLENLK